jgi:alpha-beta hydrolase superfamily lysophospholipase
MAIRYLSWTLARCRRTLLDVTSTTSPPSPALIWDEPAGIAARGTLIVLTGRGESPAVYARFGRRLAADGYRVRVLETRLDDLDATREAVVAQLDGATEPHVLVGSDSGAAVAALLAEELQVDAAILAGLADAGDAPTTWEGELEARTACPAHRKVLADAAAPGALSTTLPAPLRELPALTIPTLVVHGDADPVSALPRLSGAQTAVIAGGRHDILNDVTHRSVAATIVLFLERLRLGADLPEIVTGS